MTDIEFLKVIREICDKRCNVGIDKEGKDCGGCPFPWRFCSLDRNFYEMTDEELEKICERTREYQKQESEVSEWKQ